MTEKEINGVAIASKSRSSLPADIDQRSADNANTLLDWLGSFWSTVYSDPNFIKELQSARALRIAQLYLDLLENLKLKDRENAPVFHRERWHPITLRRSQRNVGSEGMVKLTSRTVENSDGEKVPEVNLGPQRSEVYGPCANITLGGRDVDYNGMVVYPFEGESAGLKSVLTCIVNSITSATVVLGNGTDFAILDGAIAISAAQDPFADENKDKWTVYDTEPTETSPGDSEVVLWACDAMFDRDLVYRHLGYAMRLPARSSEIYKQVVNAAWDAVASGATPLLLKSLVAAICGIPTVKEEGEVVEHVYRLVDGLIQVITDKNVYEFPKGSELKKSVKKGAVLRRFDTLDKAIRVYASPKDALRIPEYNEFLDDFDEFTEDVPAIDLPPAFFRSGLKTGFSVDWADVDVTCVGFYYDINDPETDPDKRRKFPKLRFPLEGSVSDQDKFWEDTWKRYEASGENMEDCLQGVVYDKIFEPGKVCARISPMEFFLYNLIGANTLIITVRTDTLAEDAPLYDPKFFGVIRESIPAYIRLYVIEHSAVEPERYDTDTAEDEADMYVTDRFDEEARFVKTGHRKGKGMKIRDRATSKWIASCAAHDRYDDYDD